MLSARKNYKLHAVLGWPIAILIVVFTAGLLLWTYNESIETLDIENRASLEQRRSAVDFVLANNIARIDQGLREIRDTSPLVEMVINKDRLAARNILLQLADAMESPPLDILFIQLWDGTVFASASSPFFDLSTNLGPLGEMVTPSLDDGGIIQLGEVALLLSYEPLLHNLTGQVLGRIIGATVLNGNLAILDTMHGLTKSKIVTLISDGRAISSTAPQDSEIVKNLVEVAGRRENISEPYLDPNFGSNLVAGFIPISLSGKDSSLVVATAVVDETYTVIRNSYRLHTIALIVFAAFITLFATLLVRVFTRSSLQSLLTYSVKASSEEVGHSYKHGLVEEFNTIGRAMEVMVEKIHNRTAKLAKTTNQLELAMQGARFGLWDWHIESGKATYGPLWGEILQYTPSEIPEEYSFWESRVHPEDINGLLAAKSRCMRGERSFFDKDHRVKSKSGEWVWVAARGAISERRDDNSPKRMTGILVDITERKQAEKKLRDSERRHRVVFESSPLGMVHYSKEGKILDCNDRFIDLMGSSRNKLIGFDSVNESSQKMREALKVSLQGDPSIYEDTYTSVTGSRMTFLRVIFSPVHFGAGATDVIATFEDISVRKTAEIELMRTRRLLEDAQTLGNMGAWEYNVDSRELIWTDNLYRLFGYEPGEIEDRYSFFMDRIIHPEDHGRISEILSSVMSLHKPVATDFRIVCKGGEDKIFEGVIAPHADFSGRVERVYGVIRHKAALKDRESDGFLTKEHAIKGCKLE